MNPLSKAPLGRTRLEVTRLGLGGAALGGLFHDPSEKTPTKTVTRALDRWADLPKRWLVPESSPIPMETVPGHQ